MTKYILAGGCDRLYPDYLRQLSRVIHIDVAQPKVLSCWFSNSDEDAEEKFPEYKDYFLRYFNEGTEFIKAEKDTFLNQVKDADVIYFHGGHTTLLLLAMKKFGDLTKVFEGKIVVGSSAGANYISKIGFSPSKNTAETGGGLVNLSVIVHFGSEGFSGMQFDWPYWQEAIRKVRAKSVTDQIILLPEGTFAVTEV